MIEVEHLSKQYAARRAVNDISFRVDKGEIVGFLGPNGAGKSTTLRMLTGFLSPTSGSIQIDGIDAQAEPLEAKKRFGYMPEGVPLYPEMRVAEYLTHRAQLKGVRGKEVKARVDKALELASVEDARTRIIGQLSKGYKQRVGLADALIADPPMLILDEPTSGLDPNQIRQVRDLIRRLGKEKTIFLSTHILPEVEALCDRVIIINKGQIVGQGTPDALRAGRDGTTLVRVAAKVDADALERVLLTVPGAGTLRIGAPRGDGVCEAELEVLASAEASELVFETAARAGLRLRELSMRAASLEDVFAELTTEEHKDELDVPMPQAATSETGGPS